MTAIVAGASSNNRQYWIQVRRHVYRIQLRIAKAAQIGSRVVSNRLLKGLSCMMANYHVQFLGGNGA